MVSLLVMDEHRLSLNSFLKISILVLLNEPIHILSIFFIDFNLNSNIKSEKEVKEAQNRYAKFQRENPHTPRTMKALGLPEKDIEEFCTDALFPYAE